jgi:mannose-1-phosphate guanylyltransferase/phosphomannomutase
LKAVIMAGGEGSRLRPLTCALPKPMVPVLNRPCMEHIIYLLRQHNISDTAVTLQYLPEEIKSYFGDGREYGVNLTYFTENTPLGTAGSVKNAAAFLDETFDDVAMFMDLRTVIEGINRNAMMA